MCGCLVLLIGDFFFLAWVLLCPSGPSFAPPPLGALLTLIFRAVDSFPGASSSSPFIFFCCRRPAQFVQCDPVGGSFTTTSRVGGVGVVVVSDDVNGTRRRQRILRRRQKELQPPAFQRLPSTDPSKDNNNNNTPMKDVGCIQIRRRHFRLIRKFNVN